MSTNQSSRPRRTSEKAKPDRLADAIGSLDPHSLIGSYFHTFDGEGKLYWQGAVVAEPHPGLYLIELFEWIVGGSHVQRLVRVEDMMDWHFYDTAEWMNNKYEYEIAPREEHRHENEER